MWLTFGTHNLLPKLVAQARITGEPHRVAGLRGIIRWTGPALAVALIPLLALLIPDARVGDVIVGLLTCVVGAGALAIVYILAALAKGNEQPGLSGVVQGPLPTLMALVGACAARTLNDTWTTLALMSACGLVLAAISSWLLVQRAIGAASVREAIIGARREPLDGDTFAVGLRTAVAEGNVYLPVWLGAAFGVGTVGLAALYAALRIANAFSWMFTSVTAVATPLIAAAHAQSDFGRLRSLLRRSAVAGFCLTAPIAILGVVFASQLMGTADPAWRAYAVALVLLIGGRLIDASAGPLSEALILGGRARLDLLNQTIGTLVLIAVSIVLEPQLGVVGLAAGAAASFAVANALQLLEVRLLLAGSWAPATGSAATAEGTAPNLGVRGPTWTASADAARP